MSKTKYWNGPNNWTSGYRFSKKPATNALGRKLLDYIDDCKRENKAATKKGFLLEYLGKKLTEEQIRGQLTSFFGAVKQAKIVRTTRSGNSHHYHRGPNADAYLNGNLKCKRPSPRSRGTAAPLVAVRYIIPAGTIVLVEGSFDVPIIHYRKDFDWEVFAFGGQRIGARFRIDGRVIFHKNLTEDVIFSYDELFSYTSSRKDSFGGFTTHFHLNRRYGEKWIVMHVRREDVISENGGVRQPYF